jgi:DNA-binding beta-propeller fold protein YncE
MLWSCADRPSPPAYPATGLVLISLREGAVMASATVGRDPVAVVISDDGRTAYVADSEPGDVYALTLPDLKIRWRSHVAGAPFGILFHNGRPYVTLFDSAMLVQLNPADGSIITAGGTPQHPAAITLDASGNVAVASGDSFGIALVGGTVWTADYKRSLLTAPGQSISLPLPVHPFWLARGSGDKLLIAAEGDQEDTDPGAVLSYTPVNRSFITLARPRDPDQVLASGESIFVAAHGDHRVLAIHGSTTESWATGAAVVAIAPDPSLGLLVLAVNSHE